MREQVSLFVFLSFYAPATGERKPKLKFFTAGGAV
jgi:hypothetical protein